MALADYFKGPKHKAHATRLQADLEAHRLQSQSELKTLLAKYADLEAKAKQTGALDLLTVQNRIESEEGRLVILQSKIAAADGPIPNAFDINSPRTRPKLIDGKKFSRSRLSTHLRRRWRRALVMIERLRAKPCETTSLVPRASEISSEQS